LNVRFPDPATRFYRHYNGLIVVNPALVILPVEDMNNVAPHTLHFATIAQMHKICFDTSRLNSTGQWSIFDRTTHHQITLTLASFWSNKIWAWLDDQRPIWEP
jgi:hypothetical protein